MTSRAWLRSTDTILCALIPKPTDLHSRQFTLLAILYTSTCYPLVGCYSGFISFAVTNTLTKGSTEGDIMWPTIPDHATVGLKASPKKDKHMGLCLPLSAGILSETTQTLCLQNGIAR